LQIRKLDDERRHWTATADLGIPWSLPKDVTMNSRPKRTSLLFAVFAILAPAACGSSASHSAAEPSDGSPRDSLVADVAPIDANAMCGYGDGGAMDGPAFVDKACGCPPGNVCVGEIGGVAGGGGSFCVPIPSQCQGAPSCDCMAACACTHGFGVRPEICTDQPGTIQCDNGIR
jgi:hypothetical protein